MNVFRHMGRKKRMAKISCEVLNCEYNCDGGCRLDTIKVEGEDAVVSDETVCDSYTDKNEKGCVNCVPSECACNNAEIECDAEECKYNSDCYCTADRITVGCSSACCCDETACLTFSSR